MARIRSVHPGQWKDEDFVELSPLARLLAIGLRNLADDRGVFEWKPKLLKIELFPADSVDMDQLLQEMVDHKQITRFEADGRAYGAIRNFRKWQSPKYPSNLHPLPECLEIYVGLSPNAGAFKSGNSGNAGPLKAGSSRKRPTLNVQGSGSVPPNQGNDDGSTPSVPGNSPQRERRGEEEEGEEKKESTPPNGGVSPVEPGDPPADDDPAVELPLPGAKAPPLRMPIAQAVEIWNEVAAPKLGTVMKLTDKRREHLTARLRDDFGRGDLDRWRAYCARVAASPFLTGENDRAWRADFDFAIRPDSVAKVLEGRYDPRRPLRPGPDQFTPAPGTV